MKKLTLCLALIGAVSMANAQFTAIPNGDFEAADDTLTWTSASGPGVVIAYPEVGGNLGGFASMDASNGEWGVLVSPVDPGASGGGIPIGDLGLTAGNSYDFQLDMINLKGDAAVGGIKIEAWGGNAILGNSGDVRPTLIGDGSTWETYTANYTLPVGTEKLIMVPLWGLNTYVGYDNVGVVVPEPSTIAALFGLVALGFVAYRRRK